MWEKYDPLQMDNTVSLDDMISVIQGDVLRNPKTEKNYLIHTINESEEMCVVYCYEDDSFEEWTVSEVKTKRGEGNTWPSHFT